MNEDAKEVAHGLSEIVAAFALWARGQRGELSPATTATLVRLAGKGPARAVDLAAHARISQPSMTALVAKLAAEGLVRRDRDPADGRAAVVSVTPAGASLLARRRARHTALLAPILAALPEEDLRAIATAMPALTRLAGALRRSRPLPEDAR